MRNRIYRGTTAELNALDLPEGHLAQNLDNNNLRFYLGNDPGGYECETNRAYVPPGGPGPIELIAGDMTTGFFGEVTSTELMTYEALASQIGLSAGISVFNEESLWLKFALDGNILYVAKKPCRHSISWDQLNAVQAVFGDGDQITIGSDSLKVRLLKGAASDPTTGDSGWDIATSHGSEWNRLLYPVHSGNHTRSDNPTTHSDPNAAPFGSWAQYSDSEILVHNNFGDGSYVWCQETTTVNTNRIFRGQVGITYLSNVSSDDENRFRGWRPVLELII